ncbi:MAG: segregation/condensation protein A [Coriobacteriia bacterium]|nr:segregation/condensation protein A [Coriobacteriia bacterium]MCL2537217.1 segregation/condensation protein A [Coriobacteriia bacterium]
MPKHHIQTDYFQGPFDLLLHLVSRQKLDVGAISVSEVTDQYIAHIEHMQELDLEVASEFLLLSATLLQIKAQALLPKEDHYVGDELDDLSPGEMRDVLVARLIAYKQYKNLAAALETRAEIEGHMHPRQAGLEPEFLKPLPDYLEGVSLHSLALICAELEYRKETFLLEAEHIASVPISLTEYAEGVRTMLRKNKKLDFNELIGENASPEVIVVTFLAILELYKHGALDITQDSPEDQMIIRRLSRREAQKRGVNPEDLEDFDDYN